ncbi:MAG: hypothetical protein PHZ00_01500 [Candidatus Peribacteraceae bacterium]|nr:hypothetical protein [Candidatus Peribacteraceae bacterium]
MLYWLKRILRFLLYFIVVALACMVIALTVWLLRQWWATQQARPTTQWRDTTVEQELNPYTPGTGKSASQKVWIR